MDRKSSFRRLPAAALLGALAALGGCQGGGIVETGAPMPPGSSEADESLGGYYVDGPAVASPEPHRYDVYVEYSGVIYHDRFKDGRWSGYSVVGSGVSSKPSAVSWGNGRVDLVARGSDNTVWHWWGDGDTMYGPESLGGVILYAPAISSRGVDQLQIFAVGTDHQLWERGWNGAAGTGWEPGWTPLGGWINASPGAVSMGPTETDVFVRGGDNALWHRWQRGASWFGYESLAGTLTSGPAAASTNDGRLEVYVRTTGWGIAARTYSAVGWGAWQDVPVDGSVTSDPAAIHAPNETCDHLFFREYDGSLGHRGCGDTSVVTLAGSGTLSSIQGSFETTVFSGDALAPLGNVTQETLEGIWPRELFLLDTFDDEACIGLGCGLFPPALPGPTSRRYSTIPAWQHVSPGGLDLSVDFGPFKENASASPVKQARLIDHGACSIKTRWTKSVCDSPVNNYYPDPEGVGVLDGFFYQVFDGIDSGVHSGDAADTVTRTAFYMEPAFLTPPGSTDLRARDDGFALDFAYHIHTATGWYVPDTDVDVSGAADYKMFLDAQGLLAVAPVGPVAGNVSLDLTATLAKLFHVRDIKNGGDVRASLSVDLPNQVHQGFLDALTNTGFCTTAADSAGCVGNSAENIRKAVHDRLVASGTPDAGATSIAADVVAKLTPANFVCVPDPSESTPGICKYHPAFKRVNVLPDGFELVVSDSDEAQNNDERILAILSPSDYAACQNVSRKAPLTNHGFYRLDGDVWFMK